MRTYSVSILINILLQLLDDVVEISEIKIRPFDHIDEKDEMLFSPFLDEVERIHA